MPSHHSCIQIRQKLKMPRLLSLGIENGIKSVTQLLHISWDWIFQALKSTFPSALFYTVQCSRNGNTVRYHKFRLSQNMTEYY